MSETLGWWVVVEAVGLVGLPITLACFRRLPDRGYAFAKPLTVLLGAYLFWLALSLELLPNRAGTAFWCFAAIAAVSAFLLRNAEKRREFATVLAERLTLIVTVEVLFAASLFAAAYLRSFIPEISGTEKPMDFMFLNAASRSRFYPPDDPWMSGFAVSYYYFGYVVHAMLGMLAFLPTSVTFNVGLAGTAALGVTAAFGVGFNLVAMARPAGLRGALAAGLAAALFLAVLGNLEGVLEFMRANGIGSDGFFSSMGIKNLVEAGRSDTWYPTEQSSFWWWWRATRISPDGHSITEFPFFSFLLGDLHPHVMAIPFVLTAMAAGLALWNTEGPLSERYWPGRLPLLVLLAILVGGLGFLNTWDLPTFGFLVALLVLARNLSVLDDARGALRATAGFVAPLALLAVVLYLPFYLGFSSQASGFRAVDTGATRPLHAALFWLPLAALTLPLPLHRLYSDREALTVRRARWPALVLGALLLLWGAVLLLDSGGRSVAEAVSARGWNWLSAGAFGLAFAASALALWRETEKHDSEGPPAAVYALMTVAYLLLLGAELFFVKDFFASRLNTVFKLYYQAWLLLAVAAGYGAFWLGVRWRRALAERAEMNAAWTYAVAAVVAAAFLYPIGATLSRTDGLGSRERTLDGLAFARRDNPEDIAAIDWLRRRAGLDETIVEGVEGQYSAGGRISARSGVPTVLGWGGHEVQWGRDPKVTAARQADVDRAFRTESLAEALAILQEYGVTYVVVGGLERTKYPAAGLQKFGAGLNTAFKTGQTTIYRIPKAGPAGGGQAR